MAINEFILTLLSYFLPAGIIISLVFVYIFFFNKKYLGHFLIFLFFIVIYMLSNYINVLKPSPYNHYVHFADALLHGRLHLDFTPGYHDYSYVNGKYYISQPPVPAVLMIPFVAFYGKQFSDVFFTIIVAALNCMLVYQILLSINNKHKEFKLNHELILFLTLFFGLGTVHWYVAVRGTVWHTAHIVTLFFLLLAVNEVFNKRRFLLIGTWLCLAIASRPSVFWAFPFFVLFGVKDYILTKKWKEAIINTIYFLVPFFITAFILGLLNYVRFGNVFEFGFASMQHAANLSEDLNSHGTLNIYYLARNLKIAFLNFFKIVSVFPFLGPPPDGLSMFVSSPLLLYAFKIFKSQSLNKLVIKHEVGFKQFYEEHYIVLGAILSVIATAIPLFLYFNTGWVQFGYRYILDYIPFIIILMAYAMKGKISKLSIGLWCISIFINMYGMLLYIHFSGFIFENHI